MDKKSQALHLHNLLSQYLGIWQDEIMNEYPESMTNYPKEWLELLASLSDEELYALDCKNRSHDVFKKIQNTSLHEFIEQCQNLSFVPKAQAKSLVEIEQWAYSGVKNKKKHEIEQILPQVLDLRNKYPESFDHIVDIGGGVGHLARVLAHYGNIETTSLDRNAEFQNIGKERLLKYRTLPDSKKVNFITINFGNEETSKKLKNIYTEKSLGLGLHTCGALANHLINQTLKQRSFGLLNFGCCYHHLDPQKDFPLSNFYRENNLIKLNLYAFSLATRSHAQEDFKVFKTKFQVKNYRYALHLFLMRYFNNKYFTDVGECNIKTYWRPFSTYISTKLHELNLSHEFSDEFFDNFYHSPSLQKELRSMFFANLIRWQLGRSLEIYLLIDRCLYLEENGYITELSQYFKEALSPRNVGILALHKDYLKNSMS